jgi:hypothetical protein
MTVSIAPGERLNEEWLAHFNEAVNTNMNPVRYLAIDPGKANGVCGYDTKYYLMFMLTIQSDDMVMFLDQFKNIKTCIMEGYKLYPNKMRDQIYSDMETPRVIGRVESWAKLKNIALIIQPANIKTTGYKWLGEKPLPKSNPANHMKDAHVHFTYWAVTTQRILLEDILRRNVQKRS